MKHNLKLQLEDIHLKNNKKLQKILENRFQNKVNFNGTNPFWNEESYSLTNVECFQNLGQEDRKLLLNELALDRVQEAYHIEKSGIAYGSKMTLLSQTMDERVLYASFTGDEARHFKLVEKYNSNPETDIRDNSFLNFLSNMIETAPRKSLVFMIQVLLEGWGLDHYSTMAKECKHEELKVDLESILQDEILHHGSGVILFDESELTKLERECIQESLISFFQMVQVGPLGILTRIESFTKNLSNYNRIKTLEELNAFSETEIKLQKLKRLMKKAGAISLIEELEDKSLLTPLSIGDMAKSIA
jgi:hypothetical protein